MARSRPFGLFILVLCLVASVCAHADGSKEEATKIVNEAKAAARKTLNEARTISRDSEKHLYKILAFRGSAERLTEGTTEAAKGNQAAEAIAKKVKDASDEALKLYPKTVTSAKSVVDKMKPLVTKATELDAKATAIRIERGTSDDYAETKQSAVSVKTEVDALDEEIKTVSSSLPAVSTAELKMSEFIENAVLAKYHMDVFFAVAKIDTLLESADTDIKLIEQKRNEINVIEQEMKKLCDDSPKDLIYQLSNLHSFVRDHLRSASDSVTKAKEAKEGIQKLKERVNDALLKVEAETNVDKAWEEVGIARRAVENAEEKLKDTNNALDSAEIEGMNALQRKKTAMNELNKRNKKPDATQDNKKTNPPDSSNTHKPVKVTTESPTVIETKQPTIPNPGQPMNEQTVQVTTESPTLIGTQQPTIINSDQPRSGGTEPTQPSSSDSAMTVSVPLLLALIACAALH